LLGDGSAIDKAGGVGLSVAAGIALSVAAGVAVDAVGGPLAAGPAPEGGSPGIGGVVSGKLAFDHV
jgi:hypothetical protein